MEAVRGYPMNIWRYQEVAIAKMNENISCCGDECRCKAVVCVGIDSAQGDAAV